MKVKILAAFVSIMLAMPLHAFAQSAAGLEESPFSAASPETRSPVSKTTLARLAPIFFGVASWYSATDPGINRTTANGDVFNDTKMTCASWDFQFGTRLKVTNLNNGRSVVCVVNDRGPAKRLGRLVDLTKAAFRRIADPRSGLVKVSVTPLKG